MSLNELAALILSVLALAVVPASGVLFTFAYCLSKQLHEPISLIRARRFALAGLVAGAMIWLVLVFGIRHVMGLA